MFKSACKPTWEIIPSTTSDENLSGARKAIIIPLYTKKMNKKERRLALKSALTYKANEKAVMVIENFNVESIKTKDMLKTLEGLKLSGKLLIVTTELTENNILATRNLANIKLVLANEVNSYDVLDCDTLVITEDAIKYIEEVLK